MSLRRLRHPGARPAAPTLGIVTAAEPGGAGPTLAVAAPAAETEAAGSLADERATSPPPGPEREGKLTARERRQVRREQRQAHLKRGWELIQRKDYARAREPLTRALKMADDAAVRDLLAHVPPARQGAVAGRAPPGEGGRAPYGSRTRARRYASLGGVYEQLAKRGEACRAYRVALAAAPRLRRPAGRPQSAQGRGAVGWGPPASAAGAGRRAPASAVRRGAARAARV